MVGVPSWERQDQTMAFNILNPDTFKPPLRSPDPEFEGRYRNRTECLKGEDGKAELRAIFQVFCQNPSCSIRAALRLQD